MNAYLTPAMHKFLSAIRDSEDEYAIQEGLSVWVDLDKFHAGTVLKCLQWCLIKEDQYSDGKTRIWALNDDGRKCLEDDAYVPEIVRALAKRPTERKGCRE